jgi:hypothetical protein
MEREHTDVVVVWRLSPLCVRILDGTRTYSCCGCMKAERGIYIQDAIKPTN